jgi:hypothetical protein
MANQIFLTQTTGAQFISNDMQTSMDGQNDAA